VVGFFPLEPAGQNDVIRRCTVEFPRHSSIVQMQSYPGTARQLFRHQRRAEQLQNWSETDPRGPFPHLKSLCALWGFPAAGRNKLRFFGCVEACLLTSGVFPTPVEDIIPVSVQANKPIPLAGSSIRTLRCK